MNSWQVSIEARKLLINYFHARHHPTTFFLTESTMFLNRLTLFLLILSSLISGRAEAVQRAHVSALVGLDSNTSFNCDVAHPCRFFQAATTVVDPNGEVVVLDSGGFGAVTLTKSISLVAPTGVYAGISVFPGSTGVTIATPGVSVVLRGLTINGLGGEYGVSMTNGAALTIENCVISNFTGVVVSGLTYKAGISVATAAKVDVLGTVLRDNSYAIYLENGAMAAITSTATQRNNVGVMMNGAPEGTTTSATIGDSSFSNGGMGIWADVGSPNTQARITISRTAVTNNTYGIISQSFSGTAIVTMGETTVTRNGRAFQQNGTATLESLGNNIVRQNNLPHLGTITTVPLT